MDWKGYQEEVAKLFRSLGCKAEIEKSIKGARAEHEVDVWVNFKKYGLDNNWIVECKFWNSRVPKEKVQALKSIVEDIGADKGIIITEVGFQSGAIASSGYTNIELMTFEQFSESVQQEIEENFIKRFEEKAENLLLRTHDFMTTKVVSQNRVESFPKLGVPSDFFENIGDLTLIERGLKSAKRNEFPAAISFDRAKSEVVVAKDMEELLQMTGKIIDELEHVIIETEQRINEQAQTTGNRELNEKIENDRI
ncbi:restriction endonuclease [Bacillus cereus group sp. RP32]|uniref:restriction endonuclease n=1 Tax=Bacillus cereus group sp. RP32 TaxID=3040258 RepID=UPI0033982744